MTAPFVWALTVGALGAILGTLFVVFLDAWAVPLGMAMSVLLSAPFGIAGTLFGWSYGLDRSDR